MFEGYKNSAMPSICTICVILITALFICAGTTNGQTPSVTPAIPFGAPGSAPAVCGGIRGFVLDVNGMPVSDANVTLWIDGKLADYPHDTPIFSKVYDPNSPETEGSYEYYGVYPGNYTVIAKKDGYKGTALASVSNDTVHKTLNEVNESMDTIIANITLQDYHAPSINPSASAYRGVITGVALDQNNRIIPRAEIILLQDGQAIKIPKNPQYADYNGTYIFQNITPGEYQIIADIQEGMLHKSSPVSVDVNNSTVVANITIQDYAYQPPGLPVPTDTPYPTQSTRPTTPFPGIFTIMLAMAISCFFIMKKR
jgi:hypothetical protein